MAKPGIPQGTRDFDPITVRKRNYILNIIRSTFELYGYDPLETPAMEYLDTLTGKYGEEGDQLIFKVLNNGLNDPKNIAKAQTGFDKLMQGKSSSELTERALKYDLTIPFARYVAMNHGQLTFPYKRYQVQQVWRADRPQKGRYREFTQCDADVVGSQSLLNEIELASIYDNVFQKLGITGYQLKINNRKILTALAELTGDSSKLTDITVAIDKLDKIGLEKVKAELGSKGVQTDNISRIEEYLLIKGSNQEILYQLERFFGEIAIAKKGIEELRYITSSKHDSLQIDLTLARGLNYYTGTIFEAAAPSTVKIGSIGGGGRYDDLTGLFGLPGIPGVGISFGLDRIYDVLEELNLFPKEMEVSTQALFFNMGAEENFYVLRQMQTLRQQGIACELYHEPVKLDKQFKYAERKNIPYVVIIGSIEKNNEEAQVKNLISGKQVTVKIAELPLFFSSDSK